MAGLSDVWDTLVFCVFVRTFSAGPYSGPMNFFSSWKTVLPLVVSLKRLSLVISGDFISFFVEEEGKLRKH